MDPPIDFTWERNSSPRQITFFPILPEVIGYQITELNWTFDSIDIIQQTTNFNSFTHQFNDRPEPSQFVTSRPVQLQVIYSPEITGPDLIYSHTSFISVQQSYQLTIFPTVLQNLAIVPNLSVFGEDSISTKWTWIDSLGNSSTFTGTTAPQIRFLHPGQATITAEFILRGNEITILREIAVIARDEESRETEFPPPLLHIHSVQELMTRLAETDTTKTAREVWGTLAAILAFAGVGLVAWKVLK